MQSSHQRAHGCICGYALYEEAVCVSGAHLHVSEAALLPRGADPRQVRLLRVRADTDHLQGNTGPKGVTTREIISNAPTRGWTEITSPPYLGVDSLEPLSGIRERDCNIKV
jgi:hypothetical protein